VASYPFAIFILPAEYVTPAAKTARKIGNHGVCRACQHALHVNKIEPWSHHFRSLDPSIWLTPFHTRSAKASVVRYRSGWRTQLLRLPTRGAERAVAVNKQWVDAAVILGSPSIRTHIESADNQAPDFERCADTLHALPSMLPSATWSFILKTTTESPKNPFFIAKLIDRVNSPWLRGLPDFGNSLMHLSPKTPMPDSKPCSAMPMASAT